MSKEIQEVASTSYLELANYVNNNTNKPNANKLKEISILIIDVIKDFFILFVAILVTLNYYIYKDKGEKGECEPTTANNNTEKQPNTNAFKGPWEAIQDITEDNLKNIFYFLETCMPHKARFFIFLIGVMYLFFNVVKTPKTLSLANQTFDTNVKFIFQDLWNKLTFIFIFPTLFISTISLIYVFLKIMFQLPTKSPNYGFVMATSTKAFMLILFLILFFTIAQPLYYLSSRGNNSYLYEVTTFDLIFYVISFMLIMFLMFAGFYRLIIYNFRSTFIPDVTELKKSIFGKDKEILSLFLITVIILFRTILINIKGLFSFEEWIFSVIVAFILIVLIFSSFFFGKSISSFFPFTNKSSINNNQ